MQLADVTGPARGAYASLEDLIALRFPAQQLQLGRRKRALATLAGPNKTNFRGRGIDFEEVRIYQPGDDIRSIDWRVTARTGKAHTKLFREERERPVFIVIDQRNSMFFGSTHCFKSVLAAHVASLLAWSALNGGDRVGGLVFDSNGHQEIRPRRSRKTVLALLSQTIAYNRALPLPAADEETSFADMVSNLRRIARPGSSVFLISDFRGASAPRAREHLFELCKHTELTAINCADAMESQLPRAGTYAVTNGVERSELQTSDRKLRRSYQQDYQLHRDTLSSDLLKLGVPLLWADTDQSPFALLQKYYGNVRR
ncbi:MAG: hypothetical protein ACI9JM_003196 [Halioglobus sp.]|jgi:uncharacterized protein (DUF58 family)